MNKFFLAFCRFAAACVVVAIEACFLYYFALELIALVHLGQITRRVACGNCELAPILMSKFRIDTHYVPVQHAYLRLRLDGEISDLTYWCSVALTFVRCYVVGSVWDVAMALVRPVAITLGLPARGSRKALVN